MLSVCVCVCGCCCRCVEKIREYLADGFKGPLFLPGPQGGEGGGVLSWVARQVQVRRILGVPYARWDAVR